MSPERQRHVRMGLLAALVAGGAWWYAGTPAPDVAAVAAAAARRGEQGPVPMPPVDVRLDALEGARRGPEEIARNPFVFGVREVSTAAPPRRSSATTGGAPLVPVPVLLPTGPPPLPPIPFKFIGLVEGTAGGRRLAVLSDSKGLVVHGAEGAIIDGRFRILSIGPESLEIAYADGRGRQTLRLSGQ